jgi:hypothetical protein
VRCCSLNVAGIKRSNFLTPVDIVAGEDGSGRRMWYADVSTKSACNELSRVRRYLTLSSVISALAAWHVARSPIHFLGSSVQSGYRSMCAYIMFLMSRLRWSKKEFLRHGIDDSVANFAQRPPAICRLGLKGCEAPRFAISLMLKQKLVGVRKASV